MDDLLDLAPRQRSAPLRLDQTTYYPLFDWLRFALALVVFMAHAQILTWDKSGNPSVQVFFALSGWLIGGILLDSRREVLPRF
jgi:peptidoglycan/LPS O-acetylase OafA/YrhL